MAIRAIPPAYDYVCDVCGKLHRQENAGGHYTDSRPPHWANLVVKQSAYDYQGSACADATTTRLLCDDCRPEIVSLINGWADTRRKP